MSELSDKISYIKGLCAGLEINSDSPERKLLMALVDALDSVKDELDAMRESHEELETYIDMIDDDLNELESEVYGDDDDDFDIDDEDEEEDEDEDDDNCDCDCGCHHHHDDDGCSDDLIDHPVAVRPCPDCGKPIEISMRALLNKDEPIICKNCGGKFRAHAPEDDK